MTIEVVPAGPVAEWCPSTFTTAPFTGSPASVTLNTIVWAVVFKTLTVSGLMTSPVTDCVTYSAGWLECSGRHGIL